MPSKYMIVKPGGNIELLNGEITPGTLEMSEAWAVFKVTTSNGEVTIDTIKHRGNVNFRYP